MQSHSRVVAAKYGGDSEDGRARDQGEGGGQEGADWDGAGSEEGQEVEGEEDTP